MIRIAPKARDTGAVSARPDGAGLIWHPKRAQGLEAALCLTRMTRCADMNIDDAMAWVDRNVGDAELVARTLADRVRELEAEKWHSRHKYTR